MAGRVDYTIFHQNNKEVIKMVSVLLTNAKGFVTGGLLPVVLASGEGTTGTTGISTLTDAMVSGMKDVSDQMLSAIGGLMPAILTIVAAITVVTFGIKFFKKTAK